MTPYKDLSREELLKEKENQRKTFYRTAESVNGNDGCTGQQCRSGM